MKIMILIILLLIKNGVDAQYPDCVTCPDGSIPLSPLSYNTVRSNVFNGTQPSNEGCTNGATVYRRVTINCGQGTILIDCDRGYSDSANYSDLSDYFIWNRAGSISQQVSITFKFYQQIKISRISFLFWNSSSNSITVPNVRLYWGGYFDGSIVLTNQITSITTNLPNRTITGRHILNIDINSPGLQYQYLRIEMSFYYGEWIFLGEVQFCGNTAPFHITHPSTDNDVQIVSLTVTMASVTCSLNVTIPDGMIIIWNYNNQAAIAGSNENAIQTSHGTTLLIQNPQSSDAGVYQCQFNNAPNDGWVLRRNINLKITNIGPEISDPPNDFQVMTFNNSMNSSQLMCSLNAIIPSSMTVTWLHNGTVAMAPPYEVTTTDRITTLVIRNLQPSDAGVYQCVFNDTVNGWMIKRNISVVVPVLTTATVSSNVGTTNIDVKVTIATTTITSHPVTTTITSHPVTTTITTSAPSTTNTTTITNIVTAVIKTAIATDITITTSPTITTTDTYTSIATTIGSSTLLPTLSSTSYDSSSSSSSNNNNNNNDDNNSIIGMIVAIVVIV